MQRHFSNRGEALAEVAAVKMMTHRMPVAKSSQRRSRIAWKLENTSPGVDFCNECNEEKRSERGRQIRSGSAGVISSQRDGRLL